MTWWRRFKSSSAHSQANIVCTFLIMLATIAYSILAGFQLRAMNQQLPTTQESANAAKRAADTAAETLELDRPYVSVEVEPISDLAFDPKGQGYLRLGSTAVNYGRNPALNVKVWAQFLSQAEGSRQSEKDPTAFCESLRNDALAGMNGGTYFRQVPYKASWIGEEPAGNVMSKVFASVFIACGLPIALLKRLAVHRQNLLRHESEARTNGRGYAYRQRSSGSPARHGLGPVRANNFQINVYADTLGFRLTDFFGAGGGTLSSADTASLRDSGAKDIGFEAFAMGRILIAN